LGTSATISRSGTSPAIFFVGLPNYATPVLRLFFHFGPLSPLASDGEVFGPCYNRPLCIAQMWLKFEIVNYTYVKSMALCTSFFYC